MFALGRLFGSVNETITLVLPVPLDGEIFNQDGELVTLHEDPDVIVRVADSVPRCGLKLHTLLISEIEEGVTDREGRGAFNATAAIAHFAGAELVNANCVCSVPAVPINVAVVAVK